MKTKIMNLFSMMESAESAKSAKSIFAIFAIFASANFVGKDSNESTVLYRVKSRIGSRMLLSTLLMLTVCIGNVWGTDVSVSIATYASDNSWSNGTRYESVSIDANVTATASGSSTSNTGKYYSADDSWRFYAGESGTLTISTTSGTISSVTLTFTVKDNGKISYSNTALTSGTAQSVSGSSVTFSAGSTSGSKGKVFITAISVTYTPAGGGSTPSLTADPTSLAWGTVLQGSSQSAKTISITGANLTAGDLTISATGGYSVTPTSKSVSGTLSATTLTVTPPSTSTTGAKNGKVSITGGGLAAAVEINLSMTVNAAYPVHYYVNGGEITELKEIVASGGTVSSLPTEDDIDNCDEDGHPYFVGWSTSNFGTRNTAPTTLVDGTEPITAETTYYAVFAAGTGGSSGSATYDFEAAVTSPWVNSFSTLTDGQGVTGKAGSITGNGQVTYNSKVAVTSFSFSIKRATSNTNGTVYVERSTDGSNWTSCTSWGISHFNNGSYTTETYNDDEVFDGTEYYVRVRYNSSGGAQRYIDNVSITYGTPPTYTEWITKCCDSWTPPTLSYSVPGGWKNGDSNVDATLGSGTTYGSTTWTSSDESVLTVNSSGQIHAVGAGTATVTVTWEGDATHCSQSRTSAAITVTGSVAVSFNANGGSLGTTSQSITYNTSTALTTFANLSGSAPSCKQFDHWNTAADNSGTTYTDGQSVTLLAGLTLYAIYRDITYAVSDGSMTGVASHSYSSNPIACGTTLTITCAADGDHKGNPTVTATGTHGAITVVSATSVTIANVTSAIAVSISYAEKTNVTATWHAASGSVTGGTTTTQKEGTTFTFPNVTSVDCGTFLGWTNAANSSYSSTSGKPATFYNVGATTTLDANTDFYAVYSKVSDDAVAGVLYHHEDTGTDLTDDDHTGVTVTGTGLGAYASAPYIKFDGVGDNIIFELDGTPTSFSASFTTASAGTAGFSGFTLYESDSKTGEWTKIGEEVGASSKSASFTLSISNAALFNQRVLKLEMTSKSLNVGCGEITINGLRAPINYTTNPGCVDWVLDAINVTNAPTKTTYGECEEFDPAGMVVTATMKENGNPSNTTTKDVAGYTWTPTQFMTPGNSVAVTISYTEKGVTRTTTTNVRVNDLANYTITFHDGGNTSTWTQSNHCDACNLDSRTGSLACGDYTFAGWSTSSTSYDDQSATITTWVSGSYVPTANTNLYAVYRKGVAPAEFTANCAGGTFTIGTKKGGSTIISRAANTGSFNSYEYGVENSDYTEDQLGKFLFEKVADNTYKISLEREDDYGDGIKRFYVAPDDYSAGSFEFFETYNADQCKWKVVAGTYGTWRIYTEFRNTYVTKDYGIGGRGDDALPRFRLVPTSNINGSDNYDVELTPVATPIYQSNPSCSGTYTITFNTHGGTFVQGDYEYSTETTDGLSGTTNSYFPSATMPGCMFVGWKEGSAQEEENSDAPVGLFEDGDALVVSSNKTYHAVYYYFDDDWEFDPEIGGTYHLYYEVSGIKYFVSSTPTDSWAYLSTSSDCSNAKDVVITPGTGANEGKYSISVDGYTIIPENGGTKFKRGEFWWTFTDRGDGTYAINGMNNNRNIVGNSTGTSMQHVGYNSGSSYSGWYYPSIGRCRQHHWTSDPVLMPLITLGSTGSLNVTSTNGKTVYAANKLTIEATRYGEQTKLYLFSNNANIGFRKGDGTALDADGVGPYIQTDASGELATTNITITYTPNVSTDGIETVTITVRDNTSPSVQASATRVIKARHLPTDFVIAAKNTADNKWYALPADMGGTGNPTPVEIAVDDNNNPSIAYTATSNIYNLYSNGTPQYVQLGMKNNVDGSSRSYALWANNASSSTDIGKSTGLAQNSLGGNYQWLLTQTNGSISTPQEAKYTISNPNNANPLKAWFTAGGGPKWGLYANGVAELRLIPASSIVFTEAEVVEWGQHGGVIEVDAQGINATSVVAHLGEANSSAVELSQTGTSVKGSATKYDYTVNFGNNINFADASSNGAMLTLEWKNGETVKAMSNIIVPKIVATSATMSSLIATDDPWNTADVHVLPGVTLTANAGDFSSKDVVVDRLEIYPGATVTVTKGAQDVGTLKVRTLVLRNGWTRIGEKAYDVARLYVSSDANLAKNAIENVWYADWYIDYDQYYPIAVPWNVTVANMSYLNSNNAASAGVKLRYYDGESRATNVQSGVGEGANWKEYGATGNLSIPATLTPGVGYAITAKRPTGKAFSIIRMPLTIPSAAWTTGGEQGEVSGTHKDQVSVTAHGDDNTPTYAKGWNLIANPFMSLYNGTLNYGENNTIAYANIPDINFQEYSQVPINSTTKLKPSSAFLVQAPITGTATFATSSRVAAAPSYRNAGTATTPTQKAYIVLADEQMEDMMGILVSEKYTADYELNADLEKLLSDGNTLRTYMRYNDMNMAYLAINSELAKELIPVAVRIPADGEYTFKMHEASVADELEGVYLTDYETGNVTNLLYDDYTFTASAGTLTNRFVINAIVGVHNTPTGLDITGADKDGPAKFIYHDKVYILHNNVIYDSTGKRVNVINK